MLGITTVKAVWDIVCVAEKRETGRRTPLVSLISKNPEFQEFYQTVGGEENESNPFARRHSFNGKR